MTDPTPQPTIREQLLNALDFSYCQGLGYGTPEELVAAYDATLLPPTDEAALRDRIAAAIDGVFTRWQTGLGNQRPQDAIRDAVLAVLTAPTDRAAILREAADWFDRYDVDSARELRRLAHEAQQPETQALRMPRCPRCIHDERTRAVLQQSAMELYPPDHDPNCPHHQPAAVAQPDGEA
jgi:hypothetical protein